LLALPRSDIANLIFHEFMHFKPIMGDEMDTRSGGGPARAPVPEDPRQHSDVATARLWGRKVA
jgi:hypothetical protein